MDFNLQMITIQRKRLTKFMTTFILHFASSSNHFLCPLFPSIYYPAACEVLRLFYTPPRLYGVSSPSRNATSESIARKSQSPPSTKSQAMVSRARHSDTLAVAARSTGMKIILFLNPVHVSGHEQIIQSIWSKLTIESIFMSNDFEDWKEAGQ